MPRADDANPFLEPKRQKDMVTLDLLLRRHAPDRDRAWRFLADRPAALAPEAERDLARSYLAAREEKGRESDEAKGLFEALNVLAAARAEGAEFMMERLKDAKMKRKRRLHPAVDRFVGDHYARNVPEMCKYFETAPETHSRMWKLKAAVAVLALVNLILYFMGTRPSQLRQEYQYQQQLQHGGEPAAEDLSAALDAEAEL